MSGILGSVWLSPLANPAALSVVKSQSLAVRKELGAWPGWPEEVGHLSIHSFNTYLLSTYYVPSPGPGPHGALRVDAQTFKLSLRCD